MENKKTIGTSEYTVTPFVATTGYRLGRAIAAISTNPFTAIEKFIEVDQDLSLTYQLLACVLQDGKSITKDTFDVRFDGKLSDIPPLLAYIIEVNLSGFLSGVQTQVVEKINLNLAKIEEGLKN